MTPLEKMARAIDPAGWENWDARVERKQWTPEELRVEYAEMIASGGRCAVSLDHAKAALEALRDPSEGQWGGLARQIVMWMDMYPKTPRALFSHLERSGYAIPQWMRDDPEMKALDHVPSKGTRAVLVYKAMITAALGEQP